MTAGATGIPFTDTKRLSEVCGIESSSFQTHEPSSVFVYDVIKEFGGSEKFYDKFYINSICPLGFIEQNQKGNWVNCNYYDYNELFQRNLLSQAYANRLNLELTHLYATFLERRMQNFSKK